VVTVHASGTLGTDAITVEAIAVDYPPTVEILAPEDGAAFTTNETISFVGDVSDPVETIPGANITWTSDIDGLLGTGANVVSTLTDGTHVITLVAFDSNGLEGEDSVTIQVIASVPPTVEIVEPENGESYLANETVSFLAEASDPLDGTLSGDSLVWVSNIDGPLGTGENLALALSKGTHTVVVTATNALALSTNDSVTFEVVAGPGVPVVTLSSPVDGITFGPAQSITFVGSATDLEDGTLMDASFTWRSNHDGLLGTGRMLETTLSGELDPCDTRTHVITLEVTDSDGNTVSQQISVKIEIIC